MTLTVVKCGGAALARGPFVLERFVDDGESACVVHGAGGRISAALGRAGIESHFVGGRAHGVMGDDLGLEADLLPGFGRVGMLRPVVPPSLWDLLKADGVPVIAPLARGPLNVNADDAAAILAIALSADRLVFVSDVPGVLVDGEVVPRLSAQDVAGLNGALSGGILPKLEAALAAARQGVRAEVGATLVVA